MRSELQNLLDRAGMKRSELAQRLGIHPNTVSNWSGSSGLDGRETPQYALAYLRLYVAVKELL